jgi:hypothetical protein
MNTRAMTAAEMQDYWLTHTIREHLLREHRTMVEEVKPGHYTQPDDPTWEPHDPKPRTAYSRDPKLCKHQFAGGRSYCPYCGLTNPTL